MSRGTVLQRAVLVALIGTMLVGTTLAADPTNKDINQTNKALKAAVKGQVKALKDSEKQLKATLKEIQKGDNPIEGARLISFALSSHYQRMMEAHQGALDEMDEAIADLYIKLNPVPASTPTVIPEFGLDRGTLLMKQVDKLRKDLQKSVDRTNKAIDSTRKAKLFKPDDAKLGHLGFSFPLMAAPNPGSNGPQVKDRRKGPIAHIIAVLGDATGELQVYCYVDRDSFSAIEPSIVAVDGDGTELGRTITNGGLFRATLSGFFFKNRTTVNIAIVSDDVTLAATDFTIPGQYTVEQAE